MREARDSILYFLLFIRQVGKDDRRALVGQENKDVLWRLKVKVKK